MCLYSSLPMTTDDTPRQKKQASNPINCCSMGARLKKSACIISRSFGCDTPPGLRLMTKTCSTSGWFRHSSRTPSPTMPVAPVMIVLTLMTLDSRHPLVLPMPRRSYLKKCLETPRYQFAPRARCQIQKLTAWKFHRLPPVATLKLSQFPHLKKGCRPVMPQGCQSVMSAFTERIGGYSASLDITLPLPTL